MLNTFLYVVTDEHILYRVRVAKHRTLTNFSRLSTTIDLEDESNYPSSILDHHLENVISITFQNNVNENRGVFDNKEEALLYAVKQIDNELEAVEQRRRELAEIKASFA